MFDGESGIPVLNRNDYTKIMIRRFGQRYLNDHTHLCQAHPHSKWFIEFAHRYLNQLTFIPSNMLFLFELKVAIFCLFVKLEQNIKV